ncbi:MAG: efflux RND transporter periplasmic adaptor subunit [Candidatus Limimorpha sp.]
MKNLLFAIAATSLLSMVFCSCRNQEEKRVVSPIKVDVVVMDSVASFSTHTYIGETEEAFSLPLSFLSGGKVKAIYVKNGDYVQAGQVLMCVDDTQALNTLSGAQAQLQHAQEAYQRIKQLYEKGGVAEIKLIEVTSQYESAKAYAAVAGKEVENCTLRAPQDGIISNCTVQVGQNLMPQQPVLTMLNVNGMHVLFSVPESDIGSIKIGDRGRVLIPALKNAVYDAVVIERSMTGSRFAHSYSVKMQLLGDVQQLLPGMVSKVTLNEQIIQGYIIPAQCVQQMPDGLMVWKASDGIAHHCYIKSDQYLPGGILVKEGIEKNDRIITSGYQKLYEGAKIIVNYK